MTYKKDEWQEDISIEIKGKIYYGTRKITGTRFFMQSIKYNNEKKGDMRRYEVDEIELMKHEAEDILYRLVSKYI